MAVLKRMTLSNGAKFNFEISFQIPVNTAYTEIKIVDALPAGLTYDALTRATFTSTVTTTPTVLTASYPLTSPPAEANTIEIDFNSANDLRPTAPNDVKVLVPVTVADIDALMAAQEAAAQAGEQFENIANITPYTIAGEVNTLVTEQPLSISECNMFGFGSAYNIDPATGSKAVLMFAHPTVYSNNTDDLSYTTTISLHEALNYTIGDAIKIYDVVNNELGEILPANIEYDDTSTPKTLTVSYPHEADFSEKTIYVAIPVSSNRDLITADSPLLNPTVTSLSYTSGGGTAELICQSPEYEINLNVTTTTPSITIGDKSVSLTLA